MNSLFLFTCDKALPRYHSTKAQLLSQGCRSDPSFLLQTELRSAPSLQ